MDRARAAVAATSAVAAAALLLPGGASAVVGGETTPIQSIPFQVAIYDPQIVLRSGEVANPVHSQFCAGVIRDAYHVITAGHCVMNQLPRGVAPPAKVEVLAGTNYLDTEHQPRDYIEDPVAATSFDPAWEPEAQAHDVGLLTLAEPLWQGATPAIDGKNRVAPIPLADSVPAPGTTLAVSGWGYVKEKAGGEPPSEEGVPYLRSTPLPLVSREECLRKYSSTGETVSEGTVCAGSGGHDACYQDSGGPLFQGPPAPPGAYALLGTVDFGYGCGLAAYPGVYQSMVDQTNRQFALSNPPQAPLELSPPGIGGVAAPGQVLTCSPGSWSSAPSYSYAFYVDESSAANQSARSALTGLLPQPTYAVGPAQAGERIFCMARATNAGGYDFDYSRDVTVPGTAAGDSSARPRPPTLSVVSKLCIHRRCIVNVRASSGTGSAAVVAVRATIAYKRRGVCHRRHARPRRCTLTVTVKQRSQVKPIPAGHFVVLTPRLPLGAYALSMVAIDRASVRQVKPTVVKLAIRRSKG